MSRRQHTWKLRTRDLTLGDRTLIMGVLNVTPDSFSDGGKYLDPEVAYARALELEQQGADIIDIGAESTRPGCEPISAAEELRRLVPVLKLLRGKLSIPISVDTYKSEVAERALELDVDVINDPSGFTFDPLIAKPVVQYNAGFICNHMRGRPETWNSLPPLPDVMVSVIKDLDASVNRARRSGVDRLRIMVDPGIGFGKRREQNSEILARIEELAKLELPIMVGVSRKSFLAQPDDAGTEFATAAAVAASILGGVHMVRVHDVLHLRAAVAVADEVWRCAKRLQQAREILVAETPKRDRKVSLRAVAEQSFSPARPPLRPPVNPRISEMGKPEAPAINRVEATSPELHREDERVRHESRFDKPVRSEQRERSALQPDKSKLFRPAADRGKFSPKSDPNRREHQSAKNPRSSSYEERGDRSVRPTGPPRSNQQNGGRPPSSRPFRSGQNRDARPFSPRSSGDRPFKPFRAGESRPTSPRVEDQPRNAGSSDRPGERNFKASRPRESGNWEKRGSSTNGNSPRKFDRNPTSRRSSDENRGGQPFQGPRKGPPPKRQGGFKPRKRD